MAFCKLIVSIYVAMLLKPCYNFLNKRPLSLSIISNLLI